MGSFLSVFALFARIVLGLALLGVAFLSDSNFSFGYFLLGLLFLDGAYREWRLWKLEDSLLQRKQSNVLQNDVHE
jgi:hypothetical protein